MNKDVKFLAEAYKQIHTPVNEDISLIKKKKEQFDHAVKQLQAIANEVKTLLTDDVLAVAKDIYYQGDDWYEYYSKLDDKELNAHARLVNGAMLFADFAQSSS